MMTSWENYEDFLEKLGVGLLLRKLATLGTPIVEVCKENWLQNYILLRSKHLQNFDILNFLGY